ncbi:MAG: rhodanese-like domain-containing protein [Actinobacteria bacterium]|nr:rhodanese-like domain-containing protein [Actinomycetota bacterium]
MNVPNVTVGDVPVDAVLLDVREDDEWAAGHIDGARHVPMFRVPSVVSRDPGELADGRPIVVVCAVGGRSAQVTAWLVQNGFDARNLVGGMHAWQSSGRPMVSETGAPPTTL